MSRHPTPTVRAGSAGRYRSIEIGPNTVSRSSSVGSSRLNEVATERSDRACHQPRRPIAIGGSPCLRGVPTGNPSSGCRDLRCRHGQPSRGTRVPHVAAGEAHPGRRRHRRPARTGAWRACDAPRSRPSRASASSTTPSSSAAPSPALPHLCSTRSRGRCSSTTPSALTCSTSPAPPTASPRPVDPGAAPTKPARAAPEPAVGHVGDHRRRRLRPRPAPGPARHQ